jgi:Uma2 family endonuclease
VTEPSVARRATYEDLLKVPENLVAELIDGELYTWPRPGSAHAHAGSVLGGELNAAFERGRGGPGGWWIIDEPEIHLSGEAVVPDIAGWRRDRMPKYPNTSGCDVTPDWLCEIQSESNARHDRVVKLPLYARHDVGHVWMLDPRTRTLEVLRLENRRWVVAANFGGDDVVRAEPFSEIEIPLSILWLPTPPSPQSSR